MNKFVEELKNILNEKLVSVFVYGSKAHLDSECDNNVMVIVENLDGNDLKNCSKTVSKWLKKNPLPVFMGKEEWFNSCDIYPMEYADIKAHHRIVFGENLIDCVCVEKEDLRLHIELEVKNLLMRFRGHYVSNARIKDSFIPVIKTCMAVFKGILRYKDVDVPQSHGEILDKIHNLQIADKNVYERLLCFKEKRCKINNKEVDSFANEIVCALNSLLKYTNNM